MTLTFLPVPGDDAEPVPVARQIAFVRHALRQERRLAATGSPHPAVAARRADRIREGEAVLASLHTLPRRRPRRPSETPA